MFMLDLIGWWYGNGWARILSDTKRRVSSVEEAFSISALINTLFSPWKRIVSYPGAGLDAKLRAIGDNFISRCIGFTVRFFVLIAAAISFVFFVVAGILEILIWPLIPITTILLIVKGLL